MSAIASDDVDAGGGAGGWVAGGWVAGGWVAGGWVAGGWIAGGWVAGGAGVGPGSAGGCGGGGFGRSVVGGGGGSVVVVGGAGIGSVSWICSPRTGAATPASAGPGEVRSITVVVATTVVVVTGADVVVVTGAVVDVDVDVDVAVLGRGAGSGNDGSPVSGGRRASTTVTSTGWDAAGSDPWSIWLTTKVTITAATTTPYVILELLADTWCSSRGRIARS